MALAFFLPLPCGTTAGGAVGMTAASTRTRVCGPLRTSCSGKSFFTSSQDAVSGTAAAILIGCLSPQCCTRHKDPMLEVYTAASQFQSSSQLDLC